MRESHRFSVDHRQGDIDRSEKWTTDKEMVILPAADVKGCLLFSSCWCLFFSEKENKS
jgi:hypothetical protein